MKKLIVIDVSNFIFRAFFAIRPLHAPDGTPVNAVYGVLSMIHNMITKHKPTHVLIAKDTKEGSFRNEIYPEYKANRSEPPDELIPQFALVDELIRALGIPEIKMPRYEADDVIGSIAVQWKEEFDEILIASGDKDLMQFVDGPVKMLDTMKEKIYEREDVKDKMGVYPEQIVDYLAMIGDSSDNIPGVPGIGPKGAQNLLEEYGNLETILENVEHIKNKRCKTALESNVDKALLSQELARIVTDLKLGLNAGDSSYQLRVDSEVEAFFEKVGFRSWLSKLASFKVESAETVIPKKELKVVKSEIWTLEDLKKNIAGESAIAIAHVCDDELNQQQCWNGVAVVTPKASGYLTLSIVEAINFIEVLQETHALVVCYQSKPLLQQAFLSGIKPTFKYFDVAQAHFVINPEFRHDLSTISEEFIRRNGRGRNDFSWPKSPRHFRALSAASGQNERDECGATLR
jgi:DNA polymerase-1